MARKQQDERRPSAAARGYDRDWQSRSAEFLAEHPYCAMCQEPSTVVDHVIPLSAGGADDETNWQSLCKPCHDGPKQRQDLARRKALHGG